MESALEPANPQGVNFRESATGAKMELDQVDVEGLIPSVGEGVDLTEPVDIAEAADVDHRKVA